MTMPPSLILALALALLHTAQAFGQGTTTFRPSRDAPSASERERERERAPQPDRPARPGEGDQRLREDARGVFTPQRGGARAAGAGQAAAGAGWSIVVASFRDEGRDAQAAEVLERVRTIGRLPEAYAERRGAVTVVALGNFADPTSAEAQAAMDRVRAIEIEVDGQRGRPFADAVLVPPAGFAGSLPQYDLRNVRSSEGAWALYTLQIAFYGRIDGRASTAAEMAEARKAAEEATIRLRREGEKAFYYHGPRGSTVTVGLFGDEDYRVAEGGQRVEFESPTLRMLRQRYPHNLVNGAGVRQTVTIVGPDGRPIRQRVLQPSRLVGVPNN